MRYMVWQLTNRKVVSIRLPPMEPISMLWLGPVSYTHLAVE